MELLLLTLTRSSLGRHYIAMFESTHNVSLKPTESWREALLDTRVMDLFFTVSAPPSNRFLLLLCSPHLLTSCSPLNTSSVIGSVSFLFVSYPATSAPLGTFSSTSSSPALRASFCSPLLLPLWLGVFN